MAIYFKGLQRPQREPAKERRQRQISFNPKKPRRRSPSRFLLGNLGIKRAKKGGMIGSGNDLVASLYD